MMTMIIMIMINYSKQFHSLLQRIAEDPSPTTRVLWIVDSTDEAKGLSSIQYLLPTPCPSLFALHMLAITPKM